MVELSFEKFKGHLTNYKSFVSYFLVGHNTTNYFVLLIQLIYSVLSDYSNCRSIARHRAQGLEPPFVVQIGPSYYFRLYLFIYTIAWSDKHDKHK